VGSAHGAIGKITIGKLFVFVWVVEGCTLHSAHCTNSHQLSLKEMFHLQFFFRKSLIPKKKLKIFPLSSVVSCELFLFVVQFFS
jgi:hypothetical protein